MLSRGCDDGSEGCEVVGGVEGSEGAGDLHFHLHHAQGLLGEVVGEGDGEVGKEAQNVVFEFVQSDEQVVSGPAFVPALVGGLSRKARQLAVIGEAEPEDFPIAGEEAFGTGWARVVRPARAPPRPPDWPRAGDRASVRPTAPCRTRSAP